MSISCLYCFVENKKSENHLPIVRRGYFRRKSDSKYIQRYLCLNCRRSFSRATSHAYYRQKKRHLNYPLNVLLCSGVSHRRSAKILGMSRTTIKRKLIHLGTIALETLASSNKKFPLASTVEFDDMETFEHSKCKPLSITLAVEQGTRRVLGFQVSRMPAKGLLTKKALKKYGKRKDERKRGREKLFQNLQSIVHPKAVFKSDESTHYVDTVKQFFPESFHERHKGQRGSIVGQGELKKIRFDPLFSINHTCAMLRANTNRLFRKTWCTTKKPQNLVYHLAMYAVYHNFQLLESS